MTGPEVPFPLKDEGDRAVARKHGFDPDIPFPHFIDPMPTVHLKTKREFGRAQYKANAIAGVVTVTATGTAPNFNTVVQLVQLGLMIWPPRFALYFTHPDIVLPTLRPFTVEATFHTQAHLGAVTVQDADGIHAVPVENF